MKQEKKRPLGAKSGGVQQLVVKLRSELPTVDAPDFEKEKQKNMYREFKEKVTTEPNIWRTIIESVKIKLA